MPVNDKTPFLRPDRPLFLSEVSHANQICPKTGGLVTFVAAFVATFVELAQ
jgi:hypothetical protein